MKYRAKKKGLKVSDFTQNEIADIIMNGKCEITKRSFDHMAEQKYRARPFIPSPDRIDTSKGYTRDNVRWVMNWCNVARSEYSVEDFASWTKGVRW